MRTDFLFANPSFLSGAARALDLGGTFDRYNVSRTPAEADRRALLSDFRVVLAELRQGFGKKKQEQAPATTGR